ncbi:SDR family NAD(P)-dependent oxidoreductase [Mycobacterium uberis]|uniref:SDR family NAD(P)-dependent oxidoreductase n=1 Tax=Mycobacterium uberis TaxID=2162698 RepID=UPI0024367B91|nr:SDR family NAD(P)-dependent oxidoreductase [Mycobacterium uberis]
MQLAVVSGATDKISFGCEIRLTEPRIAILTAGRNKAKPVQTTANSDRVVIHIVDLRNHDAPRQITDSVVTLRGHVDFLINSTGTDSIKPIHETNDESFDHFLSFILPHMRPGSATSTSHSTFAVVDDLHST